jgi:radical SAM superfamily enzyme YgiQ (UPF0313 family)
MSKAYFVLAQPKFGKKVSLNGITPPTGPTYLYSFAKSIGFGNYDAGVCLDMNIHSDEDLLENARAGDLVCLTATMANYDNTVILARKAKEMGCTVAIGGPWASVKAKQIQESQDCIDHIVIGEGESAIEGILRGEAPRGIIKEPPIGIQEIPSLDFSGWTRQDLLKYQDNYRVMIENGTYGATPDVIPFFTFYQSSRGCVQKPRCGFCGSRLGNCYSSRTSRQFYADLEKIASQLGTINPRIHVFDCSDSFATGLPRFHEYRSIPGMTLTVYARADEINETTAKQMKALGVTKVSVGVESGSKDVLAAIGKSTSSSQNIRAAEALKKQGIEMYASLIWGSPGESVQDLESTVQHFGELASVGNLYRVGARIVTVLPNSRWYFDLIKRLRQQDPTLAAAIEGSDTADTEMIEDLWLKHMTSIIRQDIQKAHDEICRIADESKITISSRVAKGLL